MVDLSTIPTAQLQQMQSQLQGQQQPSASPDLTKIPTEQLQMMAQKLKTPQVQVPTASGTPILDKINAFGGGAQQTLANSIGMAGGLVGDLTGNKVLTSQAEQAANALQPPGIVQQKMQENPKTALAGNAVGGIMAMGAVGGMAGMVLPEAAANYAANAVIGAAASGKGLENRALGAVSGLVLTKAANVVGGLVGKAISSANLSDTTKEVVGQANSVLKGQSSDQAAVASVTNMWNVATKVRNSLYAAFTGADGDVSATAIKSQAEATVNSLSDVMTPGQKGAFNTIANQAENVKNLNDLHELTKSFNDMKALFIKTGTAPDVGAAFKKIQSLAQDSLVANAEKLGVGDELSLAQKYNREIIAPLQKFGADDVTNGKVSPDGFLAKYIKNPTTNTPEGSPDKLGKLLNAMDSNGKEVVVANLINRISKTIDVGADGSNPLKGVKLIQDYVDLYGDKIGSEGTNTLLGMQKLLKEASVQQSTAMKQTMGFMKQAALPMLGGLVGGAHGYSQGGTLQGVGEGLAGLAATAAMEKMLGSEVGRISLQWIGEHKNGLEMAGRMLSHFMSAGAGKLVNKISGPTGLPVQAQPEQQ